MDDAFRRFFVCFRGDLARASLLFFWAVSVFFSVLCACMCVGTGRFGDVPDFSSSLFSFRGRGMYPKSSRACICFRCRVVLAYFLVLLVCRYSLWFFRPSFYFSGGILFHRVFPRSDVDYALYIFILEL